MNSSSIRLFIAVDFPLGIKKELDALLIILNAEISHPDIKIVNSQQLHITLKFLGETSQNQLEQVKQELTLIKFYPFQIKIEKGGYFYDKYNNPKVLFLKIVSTELARLAFVIENQLAKIGFSPEKRPFSPHLTLARVKGKAQPRLVESFMKLTETISFEFEIKAFILYQSQLKKEGSIYTPIQKIELEHIY